MTTATQESPQGWLEGLSSHVQAISLSLQAMMVLLVREREALVGRSEAQSLESIAHDKQSAVVQISTLYESLRIAVARHLGPDASLTDGIAALRKHSDTIAKQVDTLVQLTRKCQRANQDNGVLVNAGLDHSQRAMNTLMQIGATHARPSTYGPSATQVRSRARSQFSVRA
ncbi:MAG: flagellar biosynthesis/type III secretory pathway chaperone [Gammaproteobacteria bacterium]|jgi:flagellar biosynthesis/type III secretory pathway chaperone